MDPPLMKAELNRAIPVKDLTEVVVGRNRFRQAKRRLVPREAASDISHSDDGPRASHFSFLWRGPAGTGFDDAPSSPHGTLTQQRLRNNRPALCVRAGVNYKF
jgi:hypothetical protein